MWTDNVIVSTLDWQSRGQRFKSPQLHGRESDGTPALAGVSSRSGVACRVGSEVPFRLRVRVESARSWSEGDWLGSRRSA